MAGDHYEWEQFPRPRPERLKKDMAQPVIIDLRNIYQAEELAKHSFTYRKHWSPARARTRLAASGLGVSRNSAGLRVK